MEKIKIFIVDDVKSDRSLIKFFLKTRRNYEVVGEAEDGFSALEKLKNTLADIILMDIYMPLMDGIETSRILINEKPQQKIIVYSSSDEKGEIMQVMRIGAKAFLKKNFMREKLFLAIETVIKGDKYFESMVIN